MAHGQLLTNEHRAFRPFAPQGNGLVVACYKLFRARLAPKSGTALPSVIIDCPFAIGEALADAVDALKSHAHGWLASDQARFRPEPLMVDAL